MAALIEDTAGQIRDRPIAEPLRRLLLRAAEHCSVDLVRVTSGGQVPLGSVGKRIGSTRHDLGNAADLELEIAGQVQDFTTPEGQALFACFARTCAALGATGIGAGEAYMGPRRMHVGFGDRAVWGEGGKGANAPAWLVTAVTDGWAHPLPMADDD